MRVPTFLGEGDRYKLEREIGRGGMGSVYRAYDKKIDSAVAIKIMLDGANPEAQALFDKEWRTLKELQHPNIIGITDQGDFRDGGTKYPFFVMPFLKGKTLHERIQSRDEPLTVENVVSIVAAAADSLHAAHSRGVIHRDIKPSNIFVLESGPIVVIDFGIVHLVDNRIGTTVKGTTPYMAPELLSSTRTESPSAASDLFSLGVVCYEALTGKHPFARATDQETKQAILHEIPAPAFELNQKLSLVLSQVVQKAMAKDRSHRYLTVKEFAEKLERAFRSEPLPEFDRQAIEKKLRVVRDALSRGQATSANELMRSIEEDGFIDPAISSQRQQIDQALLQKWIREQIDSAKLYREANQHIAALEKLNEILRKSPENFEALAERDSIQEERYNNLLIEARSLIQRHLFADARIAIKDARALQPRDPQTDELLGELSQLEERDRAFHERKASLYQEAQNAHRDEQTQTALRKMEQVMEIIHQFPLSNSERDPIYQSFHEVLVAENSRVEQASQDVRRCLSDGETSDAILICDQMLAANPGNPLFAALRLEAENQERQERMNFVSAIRLDLEAIQDLDLRVKDLQDAVDRYPNESQLTELLKSAKAKRDLVNGLIARARKAEVPGRYTVALELWQAVKECHPALEGIDNEVSRVQKLQKVEAREERRVRLIHEVSALLQAGEYNRAATQSDAALSEFPADDELLAYHVEAKERALLAPMVESLVADGRKFLREGNTDAALEALRRATRLDRNNQQVRQLLGIVVLDKAKTALAADDMAGADQFFNEARTLIPDHPELKSGIARISDRNRNAAVEECLAEARKLCETGNLKDAAIRIEQSLRVYPDERRLATELTRIRRLLGDVPPAEATIVEGRLDHLSSLDTRFPRPETGGVQKLEPVSTAEPASSRFYKTAGAYWANFKTGAGSLTTNGASLVAKYWQELKPYRKPTYLVPISIGLALALGLATYAVVSNRNREVPKPVAPATVSVDLASFPEGAEISIDGKSAGNSRVRQQFELGNHEIHIALAGYEPTTETITLSAEPFSRVFTLVPLPMDLHVVTPGYTRGRVFLDKELKGDLATDAGIVIPGILAGQHELRIEAAGRETVEAMLDLMPGHPPTLISKPARDKAILWFIGSFGGKLRAECSCPMRSKLTVDNVIQMMDPGIIEAVLPDGEQFPVEVSSPGSKPQKLELKASPNPSATVVLYGWAPSQKKPVQLESVKSLLDRATKLVDAGEYSAALALVIQALERATPPESDRANALRAKINRNLQGR